MAAWASADKEGLAHGAKSGDSHPHYLAPEYSISRPQNTSLASEVRYVLARSYSEYAQLEDCVLPYHGIMPILTHSPE